jgi:hypothetical protein
MATFTLFHEALNAIGLKKIQLATDSFKALLTPNAPSQAGWLIKTDITGEIAGTFGYTTGGKALTTVTYTETAGGSGVWRFNCDDISWTAAGGAIAAHQYLVIYSDTATNKDLIGFVNRGTSDVIADGNTRTWDVGASGLFEVSTTP